MGIASRGIFSELKKMFLAFIILLLSIILLANKTDALAGSCPEWEPTFKKYGLPAQMFSQIAWRESRCNPKTVSKIRNTGYPDVGLVQIQGSWRTLTYAVCRLKPRESHLKALLKPSCNLAVAKYLFNNGGYEHWKGSTK